MRRMKGGKREGEKGKGLEAEEGWGEGIGEGEPVHHSSIRRKSPDRGKVVQRM